MHTRVHDLIYFLAGFLSAFAFLAGVVVLIACYLRPDHLPPDTPRYARGSDLGFTPKS